MRFEASCCPAGQCSHVVQRAAPSVVVNQVNGGQRDVPVRRCDRSVAQQTLKGQDVSSVPKELHGETVSQQMRMKAGYPASRAEPAEDVVHVTHGGGATGAVYEYAVCGDAQACGP